MITDKELEATKVFCERKFNDILYSKEGTDTDYIRNLQTLITLKNAVGKKGKEE